MESIFMGAMALGAFVVAAAFFDEWRWTERMLEEKRARGLPDK